jgi:glycosyltransferase involved in cell wall biosynthesis
MSQRDRVLIFNSAPIIGGAEVYTERIVTGLHERFRVSILANPRLLARIKVPVAKRRFLIVPEEIRRRRGGYRLETIYFQIRHWLGWLLKGQQTDLVHFQVYEERLINLSAPDLKRRSIPSVITIHIECTPHQISHRRPPPQEALDQFSAIVCVCDATKRNLVRLGIPADRCHVIRNGVDAEVFQPAESPGRFITWVGRISDDDKNPMLFVRIAELANKRGLPLRFRMIGDGPALSVVRKYVIDHEVHNLQLDGWIQDSREIYRDAEVLCITSNTEGLPLVLLEAMASGVPVVASNVGGIPEVIKDDSVGSLVMNCNEADFLHAIVSLCRDRDRYCAVSRNARARIKEEFSLRGMLDQLAGLYNELLTRRCDPVAQGEVSH